MSEAEAEKGARPPGFRAGRDSSYMVSVPTEKEMRLYPGCLMVGEGRWLTRPSASKCFSIHPSGALGLYASAYELLEGIPKLLLDAESKLELEKQLWVVVLVAFSSGEPLRSGYDRVVNACETAAAGRVHQPSDGEYLADRLRLLSAYAVVQVLGSAG